MTFGLTESFFGGGLGSEAGSVGGGMEEKYLKEKQRSTSMCLNKLSNESMKNTDAPMPAELKFLL